VNGYVWLGYLHRDVALVDVDLLGEEVGANGGLVLDAELAVDVLVHEGRLADTVRIFN